MNGRHGDWCERLAGAIADGRYLEDPDLWREHVEACASCRELVGGLRMLQVRLDRASARIREQAAGATDPEAMIAEAFRRYRAHRRVQGLTLGLVALVGLALGIAFLADRSSGPQPLDPSTYALRLHERVFGDSEPDYDLLKRDEALRREYLAALGHESSLVRRTAIQALMFSGIELEANRLEQVLTTWNENLDRPVEVAATREGARYLEDALARGRSETLWHVLSGVYVQATQGKARVDPGVLEPFVDDVDPRVRHFALLALGADPGYRPGARIVRRFEVEDDEQVRAAAGFLLVSGLGEAGVERVVDRLAAGSDWTVESTLLPNLGTGPSVVALARARIVDPGVPAQLALHHLRLLARAEEAPELPGALFERALADADPHTWALLARVAAELDLVDLRSALQERWRACQAGIARTGLARHLVGWDCACGAEARLHLALDILETERDEPSRERVATLTESTLPSVRERAQNLLSDW